MENCENYKELIIAILMVGDNGASQTTRRISLIAAHYPALENFLALIGAIS